MATPNAQQRNGWEFFYDQALARQADGDKHLAVEENWERVIREEPEAIHLAPPKAQRPAETPEETEGQKLMRLWERKGITIESNKSEVKNEPIQG